MNNKPNKWVAAILGLFFQPLGMLYAAQPVWAAVYLVAAWVAALLAAWNLRHYPIAGIVVLVAVYAVCAIHAYRLAARYPADKPRPHYSRWYGLLGVSAGFFVFIAMFRAFLFEPFQVASGSMLPTLAPHSFIAVQKWGYGHYSTYGVTLVKGSITSGLHRGDVIVFDFPENTSSQYIMRLIGLPGDTVTYKDKTLSINGVEVARGNSGVFQYARTGAVPEQFARFRETLDGVSHEILIEESRPPIFKEAVSPRAQDKCQYDDHGLTCVLSEGQYFVMGDNRDDSRDSRYWGFVPAGHIIGKVVYVLQPA